MKEDVSVRVCGVQRCPGAEEDVSELVCEGVFKHTADRLAARLRRAVGGRHRQNTAPLRGQPSHAHAPRRGAQRDDLRGGRVHTIFYELPLGRLTMELHTDSVCASFDGVCGHAGAMLPPDGAGRNGEREPARGHAGPALSGKTLHSGRFCQRTKSESADVVIFAVTNGKNGRKCQKAAVKFELNAHKKRRKCC